MKKLLLLSALLFLSCVGTSEAVYKWQIKVSTATDQAGYQFSGQGDFKWGASTSTYVNRISSWTVVLGSTIEGSIVVESTVSANRLNITEGVFVDRGDPSGVDFTQASLTMDGTDYPLDLSAIVPDGAKSVLMRVNMTDNSVGSLISFSKNGNANFRNNDVLRTSVANIIEDDTVIVACDSDRKIQYSATAGLTGVQITVGGWWR